jgi:hypothetical protein
MSPIFLVVRREDLVVLGVRWSGFELRHDAANPASRPHLVALSDDAFVMLIFPPQAIVEGKFEIPERLEVTPGVFRPITPDEYFANPPWIMALSAHAAVTRVQRHARLAGPSQLVFKVQRGTSIDVTAEGILQALATANRRARIVPYGVGEHLHPEDVSSEDARFVLDKLNAARTAGEIADAVEIPFERDVGVGIAQRILDRRRELGGFFTNLHEVRAVPLVGPERFTEILTAIIRAAHDPDLGTLIIHEPATAFEIPWGLYMVPIPRGPSEFSASRTVVSDHSTRPMERSGVFGLWHARLRASNGSATDAQLPLLPLGFLEDEPEENTKFHFGPLFQDDRKEIVERGRRSPPFAKRLELSALGGSLSAIGRWPGFEWDHDATLGRDQSVRTLRKGVLYPFGHRAEYVEVTERTFIRVFDPPSPSPDPHPPPGHPDHPLPPDDGSPVPIPEDAGLRAIAGLQTRRTLFVNEPVRRGVLAPGFPFSEVEILRDHFIVAQPSNQNVFTPLQSADNPLRFPLRCAAADGDVYFAMPLVFVSDGESPTTDSLAAALGTHGNVDLPGTQIDLLHSPHRRERQPSDVHEVHQLSIKGDVNGNFIPPFRPKLTKFEVKLPALRTLLPGDPEHNKPRVLEYSQQFLDGDDPDIALEPVTGEIIDVNFTTRADRSGGLVAPKFEVDGIHRTFGPVARDALPEVPDLASALSSVYEGATLLGFPLASLIKVAESAKPEPPKIVQSLSGLTPGVQMKWELGLKDAGPFKAKENSKLTLTVDSAGDLPPPPDRPPSLNAQTTCTVENFQLVLPPGDDALLILTFGSVVFTQKLGQAPDLQINKLDVALAGDLELLKKLQTAVQEAIGDHADRPTIKTLPNGISAGYGLSLPKVEAGVFVMQNIATRAGVDVPFDGKPVTVSLAFASRDNPFSLTINAFGGGGYIDVQIQGQGDPTVEASLEFGGIVAISFVIGFAEVHALGGVRYFVKPGGLVDFDAFIRIGGSVNVLGLVSVSVELRVTLKLEQPKPTPNVPDPDPRLVGRATLVIEIDLTLYATSVTLDSGEYVLVGGDGASLDQRGDQPVLDEDPGLRAWREYRQAFAAP